VGGGVVLTSFFLFNRVPLKKLDLTPYELWKRYAPNLNYLKVWDVWPKLHCLVINVQTLAPRRLMLFSLVMLKIVLHIDLCHYLIFPFLNREMLNFLSMFYL